MIDQARLQSPVNVIMCGGVRVGVHMSVNVHGYKDYEARPYMHAYAHRCIVCTCVHPCVKGGCECACISVCIFVYSLLGGIICKCAHKCLHDIPRA